MNDTIILNEIQKREEAKQDGTLASKDQMFERFSQSIDKMAETRESLDDIYCPRCNEPVTTITKNFPSHT